MLRKYIYWLVIILVGWYLGRHFAELRHVVTVMSHGTWYWLLAAGALQVAHYGFHALNLQESFALFKIKGRYREYFGLALSSLAVNVVAPSLNISGVAYIVDEMRRRKHSGAAALVATMLTILIDGTVFVSFAVVAVLVLVLRQRASSGILLGVGALATVLLSVCLVLAYFWDRPHRVSAALQLFGKERAKRWGEEWHMLVSTPMDVRQLWRPFAAEYAAHTCNFATQLCVPGFWRAFEWLHAYYYLCCRRFVCGTFAHPNGHWLCRRWNGGGDDSSGCCTSNGHRHCALGARSQLLGAVLDRDNLLIRT